MLAAVLAQGETVLATPPASRRSTTWPTASTRWAPRSKAREPRPITIVGVARLHGATHSVIPDRIETGTYAWPRPWPGARCG